MDFSLIKIHNSSTSANEAKSEVCEIKIRRIRINLCWRTWSIIETSSNPWSNNSIDSFKVLSLDAFSCINLTNLFV